MTETTDTATGTGGDGDSGGGPERSGDGGGRGDPRTDALKCFGAQVKWLRERAGLKREELGRRLGYAEPTVASVEQGRRFPSSVFIAKADDILAAGGVLRAAEPHLSRLRYPVWFRDFAALEASAVALNVYETHVLPGILQTEDYARAVFTSSRPPLSKDEIQRRVEARLARQTLLQRDPAPVIGFVLEQAILERSLGGPEVMAGQLRRLLECMEMRNIDIQIMPPAPESHAGLAGPMYLVENDEHQRLVYFEGQRGSVLVSDPRDVSELNIRYGILRTQARSAEDSASLLTRLLGEL